MEGKNQHRRKQYSLWESLDKRARKISVETAGSLAGIKADSVLLHENARVDGTIKAPSGVSFVRDAAEMPSVLAEVNVLGKEVASKVRRAGRSRENSRWTLQKPWT